MRKVITGLGVLASILGFLGMPQGFAKIHKPFIIKYIKIEHKNRYDFQHIAEYLSTPKHEVFWNRTIVRTDPTQRAGTYFIMKLSQNVTQLPEICKVIIEYYYSGDGHLKTQTLDLPLLKNRTRSKNLYFGLTGANDLPPGEQILAWNIRIQNATGTDLAQRQSYLWNMKQPLKQP